MCCQLCKAFLEKTVGITDVLNNKEPVFAKYTFLLVKLSALCCIGYGQRVMRPQGGICNGKKSVYVTSAWIWKQKMSDSE